LASGIVLPGNAGLSDPTSGGEDIVAHLTKQEREDITYKAQHALRLIAFNVRKRNFFLKSFNLCFSK